MTGQHMALSPNSELRIFRVNMLCTARKNGKQKYFANTLTQQQNAGVIECLVQMKKLKNCGPCTNKIRVIILNSVYIAELNIISNAIIKFWNFPILIGQSMISLSPSLYMKPRPYSQIPHWMILIQIAMHCLMQRLTMAKRTQNNRT